jgi:hypothetical protein
MAVDMVEGRIEHQVGTDPTQATITSPEWDYENNCLENCNSPHTVDSEPNDIFCSRWLRREGQSEKTGFRSILSCEEAQRRQHHVLTLPSMHQ